MNRAQVARALYAAYVNDDRPAVAKLLTDDFTFTSPYDDHIDKTTYFERCWPKQGWIRTMVVEQTFEHDDDVAVVYSVETGEGKSFRNVELLTFDGERLRSVQVFFGATYVNGAFVSQPAS
jgi:ketosteroid isomerase-like protein